ncbi:MAG: carboxymuconolactone decarboxylase family protein [Spirochaetaceae bacterium]|jgi:AhpD family alkylhydroperoxidase|nr:carboxymuconolactone decarboxylase family protein [Spirochaetaceae bacterium]
MKTSKAFEVFAKDAAEYHETWMEAVQKLDKANKLDQKTKDLAYLAVLAATRLESGIPFHVKMAKLHGATREEIIGSILVGLPAVGNTVTQVLPIALETYDEAE